MRSSGLGKPFGEDLIVGIEEEHRRDHSLGTEATDHLLEFEKVWATSGVDDHGESLTGPFFQVGSGNDVRNQISRKIVDDEEADIFEGLGSEGTSGTGHP